MLPSPGKVMIPVKINCAQDINRLLLLRSLHNETRKCFHLCYGHVKREKAGLHHVVLQDGASFIACC